MAKIVQVKLDCVRLYIEGVGIDASLGEGETFLLGKRSLRFYRSEEGVRYLDCITRKGNVAYTLELEEGINYEITPNRAIEVRLPEDEQNPLWHVVRSWGLAVGLLKELPVHGSLKLTLDFAKYSWEPGFYGDDDDEVVFLNDRVVTDGIVEIVKVDQCCDFTRVRVHDATCVVVVNTRDGGSAQVIDIFIARDVLPANVHDTLRRANLMYDFKAELAKYEQ